MFLTRVFTSVSRAFHQLVRGQRTLHRLPFYILDDKKRPCPAVLPSLTTIPKFSRPKAACLKRPSVKKSHRVFDEGEGFGSLGKDYAVKSVPGRSSTYFYKVGEQAVACHVMLKSTPRNNSRPASIATTHSSEWSSDDEISV
jgi:hypothetical protein